ncbi:MAG: methyltransferase domain-containing protein [Candidatus Lokiarchaeota archaeon]|nr:methyltransferase domain-containing protein [Candidatus Lokiarchaeota archaeon]MBD3202465.1 methyltransferase domain-containing protein [Candidatus Lokiarchaeota archaeon]
MIPKIQNPNILDVGCGSGVPTIELAKLSSGHITGIEINREELHKLEKKIKDSDIGNQVKTIYGSLLEYEFPQNYFDIIWAEGVFHIIGFAKSFKKCYEILKKGGFLVLNTQITKMQEVQDKINTYGYEFFNKYELPNEVWWNEFYKPLEEEINNLIDKNKSLRKNDQIRRYQEEIKMVKSDPQRFNSAFYIFKKI